MQSLTSPSSSDGVEQVNTWMGQQCSSIFSCTKCNVAFGTLDLNCHPWCSHIQDTMNCIWEFLDDTERLGPGVSELLGLALRDCRCIEPNQVSTLIWSKYHGPSCHWDSSANLDCGPTTPLLADMLTPDADEGIPHAQHGKRPEASVSHTWC